jgi:hypothetical protein
LQAQSPEFKPQSYQKQERERNSTKNNRKQTDSQLPHDVESFENGFTDGMWDKSIVPTLKKDM